MTCSNTLPACVPTGTVLRPVTGLYAASCDWNAARRPRTSYESKLTDVTIGLSNTARRVAADHALAR